MLLFDTIAAAIGPVFGFVDDAWYTNSEQGADANDAAYIASQQTLANAQYLSAQDAAAFTQDEVQQYIIAGSIIIAIIIVIIIAILLIKK